MVGPPKDLHELAKIDAAVQLRCEDCGHTQLRGLDDLIAEVREARGSTTWPYFRDALKCPKCECSGAMLRPRVMPFTAGTKRPRTYQALVINLALQILREASWRPSGAAKATLDVRLALHVLRSFVPAEELTAFWQRADTASPHPWESCRPLYTQIAATVIKRGHVVWIRNRP